MRHFFYFLSLIFFLLSVHPLWGATEEMLITQISELSQKERLSEDTRKVFLSQKGLKRQHARSETLTFLEEIHEYYKQRQKLYYFPLLDFLVSNKKTFSEFPDSLPLDTLLEAYMIDRYSRYRDYKKFERESHERQYAEIIKQLPENLEIPSPRSSDTYQSIVIDISDQRLYAFADGILIDSSLITSGRKGFGTIRGDFSVKKKQTHRIISSPFKDPKHQYRLHVDYWIQFHKSFGIHDACNSKNCWRKKFGTPDYSTNGSHGCINTPYEFMGWLYDWSLPGTRVSVIQ